MVSLRIQSPTQEDTWGSSDLSAIAEMRDAMEKLCRQNQNLEDNILNIQQRQQKTTPIEEMEVFDP